MVDLRTVDLLVYLLCSPPWPRYLGPLSIYGPVMVSLARPDLMVLSHCALGFVKLALCILYRARKVVSFFLQFFMSAGATIGSNVAKKYRTYRFSRFTFAHEIKPWIRLDPDLFRRIWKIFT